MEKNTCPYCGCEEVEMFDEETYMCPECDAEYTDADREKELCRKRILVLIANTSEKCPKELKEGFPIGEENEENYGLSSLQLPWAKKVYQECDPIVDGDAIVWVRTDLGSDIDSDELTINELKMLEEELMKNY